MSGLGWFVLGAVFGVVVLALWLRFDAPAPNASRRAARTPGGKGQTAEHSILSSRPLGQRPPADCVPAAGHVSDVYVEDGIIHFRQMATVVVPDGMNIRIIDQDGEPVPHESSQTEAGCDSSSDSSDSGGTWGGADSGNFGGCDP